MKKINIYDGFTFVTKPSLNNMKGFYTIGSGINDYSNDFYGLKKGEAINFPQLIKFITLESSVAPLRWQQFIASRFSYPETIVIGTDGIVQVERSVSKTIPFEYINEYKQKIVTSVECGINKRIDLISNIPYPAIFFDYSQKKVNFVLSYFYKGTEKERQSYFETLNPKDFTINEQFKGIKFFSENITDVYYLVKKIQNSKEVIWFKTYVNKYYIKEIRNCKSVENLIFLYKYAPDFTLAELSKEDLWNHIKIFYNYDTAGKLSFIKDASTQLMRALFAFNTPEKIKYLMEQFHKNQSFIKKIYDALDGTISFMGQEQKCQTVFASILTSFCFTDISTLNFTNEVFYVGKEYSVNVKDVESNDKEQQKYWVEQYYKSEPNYVDTGTTVIEIGGNALQNRLKMNPLDIVTLLQKDTDSLLYVPVIFLKDIDHQKDIENLLTAVRIGVDMLAIGLTIATLGGASPLLAVVGALEITLSTTDILVQVSQDKVGKEFLEKWEKIYTIGGIATASPVAVAGLYKLGGTILASSAKAEIKNFAQSCMMKLMLEYNVGKFTLSTLKIVDYEKIAFSFQYRSVAKELLNNGALFVEGDIKIGNTIKKHFGIVYKGETIKTVTEYGQKSDLISDFFRLNDKELTKKLDIISDTIKYERGRMGYVDGLFDAIDANYKPKGFDMIDKFVEITEYGKQCRTNFVNFDGYFIRNFDANKKIFTFNHGFLEDLPKWVEDVKIPLVEGKGIPTQAYFTLRQMKLLGIAKGDIQTVKMAQIQNLETMGYIYQTMKEKNLVNLANIDILKAPSNDYMKTVMTQAGYEIMGGKIVITDITRCEKISFLKQNGFSISKEFMEKYGLTETTKLYFNFNIEAKVKFIKK